MPKAKSLIHIYLSYQHELNKIARPLAAYALTGTFASINNIRTAKMKKLLIALCALGFAASAFASSDTPCKDDAQKLCAGKKGREQIKACLIENKEKISPACKAKIEEKAAEKKQ